MALLDADRDFARGLPWEELERARRVLVLPRLDVPAGEWTPPRRRPWPAPVTGAVVLEGLLARDVELAGRTSTQLIGPGDVIDPWGAPDELLPCTVRWSSYVSTKLAILDARFSLAARRWPSLATVVQRRLCERADRLASHTALLQLPSVDLRVLALLWQLAERFGHVGADGVILPLPLTHRLVGQLVGARRSTVTLAFTQLTSSGDVTCVRGGGWLLAHGSRDALS